MPYRDWANLGIQLKADYELFNSVSGNMVLMQGRIFGGGGGGNQAHLNNKAHCLNNLVLV